jgi:hypothetical protein
VSDQPKQPVLRPEHAIDKPTLRRMLEIMNRDDLNRLLGPFPVRCPLDAVLLETADCGLYVRETITGNHNNRCTEMNDQATLQSIARSGHRKNPPSSAARGGTHT